MAQKAGKMRAAMLANVLAMAVTGLTASIPRGPVQTTRFNPPRNWHDPEKVQKAHEKRAMRAAKALKAAGVK